MSTLKLDSIILKSLDGYENTVLQEVYYCTTTLVRKYHCNGACVILQALEPVYKILTDSSLENKRIFHDLFLLFTLQVETNTRGGITV
jgi:hypothetical protein